VFFASPTMQSFYKRFIRDFMRYKDDIQCPGAELLAAIRAESLELFPNSNGDFYALHIRRGDFQFKVQQLAYSYSYCYYILDIVYVGSENKCSSNREKFTYINRSTIDTTRFFCVHCN
jgi:hypothetical protein